MNDNTSQQPTLVLGGTGKIGRRVVERLTARGLPVRIGSRSGEPRFDWEDRSTWDPILEGVGSAYVAHYWDALPGAAETLGSFAELAVERGVPRLVLLSGRGEEEATRAVRAVRDAGAELTVLHSTWFAQNFSETFWLEQVQGNELALPAGDTPAPFVDADDIADVAVAALTDDRHIGEVYELTGPRLLTFAEAVREISRAVGREIRYVPISIEDFVAAAELGVPSEVVEMLTYIFDEVLDGRNARLADGVQRAARLQRLRTRRGRHRHLESAGQPGHVTSSGSRHPHQPHGGERKPTWPAALHPASPPTETENRWPGTMQNKRATGADRTADLVLSAAVIAMGLLAGLFYAFDVAVMPALTAADDRTFVDAMQQMIDKMNNSAFFMSTLLGAPVLAAVAFFQARRAGSARTAGWIVAGLAFYTVMVVVTVAVHFPLNDELMKAGDPVRIENPAAVRDDFVTPWVAWNIVRTLALTAAFGCLARALVLRGRLGRAEQPHRTDGYGRG